MVSDHIFHWTPHVEVRRVAMTRKQQEAIESILRGETIEEWLSHMSPKDLEQWERIFRRGAQVAPVDIAKTLTAMARECRKIRDEENAKDAADG